MYDRKISSGTVTLQVSGMLWQRSLVMRDTETGSLWSHLLGEAMRGKYKGTHLTMLPASISTWGDWKKKFPKTTVLSLTRTSKAFRANVWNAPKKFVYGIPLGLAQPAPAVSLLLLQKKTFCTLKAEETSLLVIYALPGKRVQAFNASIEGKVVEFQLGKKGKLIDVKTKSVWDRATGKALSGELKGKRLTVMPGTISYRKAWKLFYPNDQIIE